MRAVIYICAMSFKYLFRARRYLLWLHQHMSLGTFYLSALEWNGIDCPVRSGPQQPVGVAKELSDIVLSDCLLCLLHSAEPSLLISNGLTTPSPPKVTA